MVRGTFILSILEALWNAALETAELFEVLMSAGYGASYGKLEYERSRLHARRGHTAAGWEKNHEARVRYQKLVSKLKREGFIAERRIERGKVFAITPKGRKKLAALRDGARRQMPSVSYPVEAGNCLVIVAFDVPEKERRKRNWLRAALRDLGFVMVQKSVWVGKVKIPQQFLDDVFKLHLADNVEIFEVSKSGSLTHVL